MSLLVSFLVPFVVPFLVPFLVPVLVPSAGVTLVNFETVNRINLKCMACGKCYIPSRSVWVTYTKCKNAFDVSDIFLYLFQMFGSEQ